MLAPCEDGLGLALGDDGKEEDRTFVSTDVPLRKRGGRSKRTLGKAAISEQQLESIGSIMEDQPSDSGHKIGKQINDICKKIAPVSESLADKVVAQHREIKRLRRQRDAAALHLIVARGKLATVRQRIASHSDARYLDFLDDISSEPSDCTEEYSDDSDFSRDTSASDESPDWPDPAGDASAAPVLGYLTVGDARRLI